MRHSTLTDLRPSAPGTSFAREGGERIAHPSGAHEACDELRIDTPATGDDPVEHLDKLIYLRDPRLEHVADTAPTAGAPSRARPRCTPTAPEGPAEALRRRYRAASSPSVVCVGGMREVDDPTSGCSVRATREGDWRHLASPTTSEPAALEEDGKALTKQDIVISQNDARRALMGALRPVFRFASTPFLGLPIAQVSGLTGCQDGGCLHGETASIRDPHSPDSDMSGLGRERMSSTATVIELADQRSGHPRSPSVELPGRRAECETLDQVVDAVRAGESRALVIRGEAGIGKRALRHSSSRRGRPAAGCSGSGLQSEMELAFAALHQLCAPIMDRLPRCPSPATDALQRRSPSEEGCPEPVPRRLGRPSASSQIAEDRPLVCLIDDAQWSTARRHSVALAAAALSQSRSRWSSPVPRRSTREDLTGLPELLVGGLSEIDAQALLTSVIPVLPGRNVRNWIVARLAATRSPFSSCRRPCRPPSSASGWCCRPAVASPARSRIASAGASRGYPSIHNGCC